MGQWWGWMVARREVCGSMPSSGGRPSTCRGFVETRNRPSPFFGVWCCRPFSRGSTKEMIGGFIRGSEMNRRRRHCESEAKEITSKVISVDLIGFWPRVAPPIASVLLFFVASILLKKVNSVAPDVISRRHRGARVLFSLFFISTSELTGLLSGY